MRIVCLAENISENPNIGAEHGLSLYIETMGRRILFDMGQTELFAENAEKLGIDLSLVDMAVLSHGHYDHGGGLKKFLSLNDRAPVYVSRHAFGAHYNGREKYIGLDPELRKEPRLILTDDFLEPAPSMELISCNGREQILPMGSFGLNMVEDGEFLPDDFRHEQYLLIKEGKKKILISGCSHKGIVNIVHWFSPQVLVGGFHFSKLPCDETLAGYAKRLGEFPTSYYTCHCTGKEQYDFMKPYIKSLFYLSSGQTINI